ncbi:MAG: hypothetical protein UU93_C0014G0002 [Candidatus Amesbacteria bacterium GW2011_GWA2_42_12]|uniref:Uncharacterized protein n=1 Tax=Candidatus Amesbacteria bacterium GW2011_GWA2_42_12 TaxID=1618356 RepID=A0A0G0Y4L8_9BACT|nr:MAG: hypothetical protein UU93_C0014G0002 [Candidatus Amesbacteria bacterium GW2011_GWA2_42_12]
MNEFTSIETLKQHNATTDQGAIDRVAITNEKGTAEVILTQYPSDKKEKKPIGIRMAWKKRFNPEDLQHMRETLEDSRVQKYLTDLSEIDEASDRDIESWMRNTDKDFDYGFLIPIARFEQGSNVTEKHGEFVGFSYVYREETKDKRPIARTKRLQEMFPNLGIDRDTDVFSLSFAKYPQAEKGLIADGVRQTLIRLSGMQDFVEAAKKQTKPIAMIAYVEESNIPSKNLLEQCGFIKVGNIPYDNTKKEHEHPSAVYVLNWNTLFPWENASAFQPEEKDANQRHAPQFVYGRRLNSTSP